MSEESPFRSFYADFRAGDIVTKTFLGGLRLSTRRRLFVILGLAAVIALGGLFYTADRDAGPAIEELQSTQRLANLVAAIEGGALRIFSDQQDFLRDKDLRYAENYQKRVEPIIAALEDLDALPAAEAMEKDISTLNDGVAQHAAQFTKVVETQKILGIDDGVGLARLLRASSDALEAKLADLKKPALTARFIQLRQFERNIRAAASQDDLGKVEKDVTGFKASLEASDLNPADKAALGDLVDSYGADATQFGRTSLALAREVARLGEINKYMAPSLDSIAAGAVRLMVVAENNLAQARQRLRFVIGGGTGAIVVLLILFGYILMRSVTTPLAALAESATRLAHGDRTTSIPALGNRDSAGEVANALAYFRENMIEADRLRAELEESLKPAGGEEDADEKTQVEPAEAGAKIEIARPGAEPKEGEAGKTELAGEEIEESLSAIGRRVAATSENASNAAYDAERTDTMISGLIEAQDKIGEVESLLASISDQTGFLAVESSIRNGIGDDKNLVVLPGKRGDDTGQGGPVSEDERIKAVQAMARHAINLLREIGGHLNSVHDVASDFAATTSTQALDAATELLHQSEHLRGMLDDMLGKIRPGGARSADAE